MLVNTLKMCPTCYNNYILCIGNLGLISNEVKI